MKYTKQKRDVWLKTNGRCWYCGLHLRMDPILPKKKQDLRSHFCIDHFDPQKRNGGDNLENLVPACRSCNSTKRHKTVEEYRRWLAWKDIGEFSESQIEWLRSHGIEVPDPPKVIFYYETIGSDAS